MALVNRDQDVSEQRETAQADLGLMGTSLTTPIYVAPYPVTVDAVRVAALGISGTPTAVLKVERNTAAGATTITGGWTTLTLQAVGTSGVQSVVAAASGSSFLSLATGDVISYTSGGANSAAFVAVAVVAKALQDIKNQFNAF